MNSASVPSLISKGKRPLALLRRYLAAQYRLTKYRRLVKDNIISIKEIKLYLDPYISDYVRRSIYEGGYEAAELKIIQSQLSQNGTVFEVGAGIGLISSFCAKMIGSDRVFAYEANPAPEFLIRKNYALNKVSPALDICLLGEQLGETIFYTHQDFWSSSTVQTSPDSKAITVPVKTLNDEVYRINPSFLIVDIEGGEYDLFQHLDFHNIQKIMIEVHENFISADKAADVINKMTQTGFKIDHKCSTQQELFLCR
jgi:FkbM family methyltransferase